MAVELQANPRNNSKKSTISKLRREGDVPAVVYGNGLESRSISFSSSDFVKVIRKSGRNGVITLKVDNDNYPVMVYELQYDTIKDELIHADFYKVDMKSEVDAEVGIHLIGEAPGHKEGGVVQQLMHELEVRALPAEIPDYIEVNIEALNIGDSLSVSDIEKKGSFEILTDSEETIVSVTPPQVEEEVEEESDEAQEPELVDQEKEEGSEGEEE